MGFDKNPKSRINLFVYPLKMDDSAILSTVSLLVALGGTLLAITNHKRVRSTCCGRNLSVSVDIENTTPPVPKLDDPPLSVK